MSSLTGTTRSRRPPLAAAAAALILAAGTTGPLLGSQDRDPFLFRSGVEFVDVTVTVTDDEGHFVTGLTADDFIVYEDDKTQTITHFSADRVPVSLGILVDTSGSMEGDKIDAARRALRRFLSDLLAPDDELFLYRFNDDTELLQNWTNDRALLSRALGRLAPSGGTAMYDAVSEAVPIAAQGRHRKKALVIISDGNDTSSQTRASLVRQAIRESEVLVYAVGIDGDADTPVLRQPYPRRNPLPIPIPLPPGRGRWPPRRPGGFNPQILGAPGSAQMDARVNADALRALTDDSGGRTEIIRSVRDLDPATAGIADELSQQYYLGYPTSGERNGEWRSIRVALRDGDGHQIRARKGYFAN
ncbi:MAG: VWA domain-containing protein [Vicinamibacterales bacterium]